MKAKRRNDTDARGICTRGLSQKPEHSLSGTRPRRSISSVGAFSKIGSKHENSEGTYALARLRTSGPGTCLTNLLRLPVEKDCTSGRLWDCDSLKCALTAARRTMESRLEARGKAEACRKAEVQFGKEKFPRSRQCE
ncbi:hypothetical protein CERSUDRAFT_118200 [Gelatoporia subvermispora B]|uniref:Uncharacterized protein n=1 Tax=Ceriporiopsis subvermispora (strain B) TaxID=914234 RepID=M2Q8F8_CERS8|nr:hypothetical protein CERSUDRAFT_118200 [Gelatoporia subvermispora B]